VSEESAPAALAVIWSAEARTDLRSIDRETAMQMSLQPGSLFG